MKNIFLTSLLVLAACSSYHNSKVGMTLSGTDIEIVPQEAKVSIDTKEKITGSAECSSLLWVFSSVPMRQTYGVDLQTTEGKIASTGCVAAAIYDAMSDTDADILVMPQYTIVKDGLLCFGYNCLVGSTKVIVSGYAGKVVSINDMDKNRVQFKNMNVSVSKR